MGEKNKVGSNGNKLGPTKKLSLDSKTAKGWIQKQLRSELKFTMGPV